MNRYQNALNIDTTKQVKYHLSVLPVSIKQEEIPFVYISKGDRLDNISNAFYKTPRLWWVIAQANGLNNGGLAVPAGTPLYIPKL